MNTARKGSAAEVFVARWLQDRGWLVASRRHIGGAGDLLAIHPLGFLEAPTYASPGRGPMQEVSAGKTLLLEVKACKELWQQFRREDRQAMRETPLPPGGERFVVNVRGSGEKRELIWIPESSWP